MTIFDLLFILAFISGAVAIFVAAYLAIRGHFWRAGGILLRLIVSAAAYLLVVALVSVCSPQRIMKVGDERCLDDWCFAVTKASATGPLYAVDIRLFSRAKGRPQRAKDVAVFLLDASGTRFEPMKATAAEVPFDVLLGPGESVIATRFFAPPVAVHDVGLVLEHGGSGPGLFIIGDDLSLFHKRTLVRLA